MRLFDSLVRTVANVVLLPVDVLNDMVGDGYTAGNSSYVSERLSKIKGEVEKYTVDDSDNIKK